jgi:hypothetical protein
LFLGTQDLYGVTMGKYTPGDISSFLKTMAGWAFTVPVSAYYLSGSLYDLNHFIHHTPDGSGHSLAIDVRSTGVYVLDPLDGMNDIATWVDFTSSEFASLCQAYNAWGKDFMLGLKIGSLTPAPVIPYTPGGFTKMPFIKPFRVLDTRSNVGLSGKFQAHQPRVVKITGLGGVPDEATGVIANLTVTTQTSGGYLVVTPTPTDPPETSTLNFPVKDNRANFVMVGLAPDGTVAIEYVAPVGATTDAILDVTGYTI